MKTTQCYICHATVPDTTGAVSDHRYMPQSAGCWKLYTEVLAREYGEWKYPPIHRLTVDSYVAQHPTLEPNKKSAQSVMAHLAGIYLALEKKMEPHKITPQIGKLVDEYGSKCVWTNPPANLGNITIADVHTVITLDDHTKAVYRWAESVWNAWSARQDEVRRIVKEVCSL